MPKVIGFDNLPDPADLIKINNIGMEKEEALTLLNEMSINNRITYQNEYGEYIVLGVTPLDDFFHDGSYDIPAHEDCIYPYDLKDFNISFGDIINQINEKTNNPCVVHIIDKNGAEHLIASSYDMIQPPAIVFNARVADIDERENAMFVHTPNVGGNEKFKYGTAAYIIPAKGVAVDLHPFRGNIISSLDGAKACNFKFDKFTDECINEEFFKEILNGKISECHFARYAYKMPEEFKNKYKDQIYNLFKNKQEIIPMCFMGTDSLKDKEILIYCFKMARIIERYRAGTVDQQTKMLESMDKSLWKDKKFLEEIIPYINFEDPQRFNFRAFEENLPYKLKNDKEFITYVIQNGTEDFYHIKQFRHLDALSSGLINETKNQLKFIDTLSKLKQQTANLSKQLNDVLKTKDVIKETIDSIESPNNNNYSDIGDGR